MTAQKRRPFGGIRRRYSGILKEPMPPLSKIGPVGATIDSMQKLGALLDHYEISNDDDDRWFLLAVSLAIDHIPSFRPQPENHRGGKPISGDQIARDIALFTALGTAELEGKSVSNAARLLTQRPGMFQGKNPASLRQRYLRLKKFDSEGKRMVAAHAAISKNL